MITIHHLWPSQSERIVWLMEELGLPYELVWYRRPMPAAYLALHPAATAPVVQDGDRTLCESAAIIEYIVHKYAGGKFTVRPDQPNYYDYVYWMHFNNNLVGLFYAKALIGDRTEDRFAKTVVRREDGYARMVEQRLAESPYLAGPEFTCADIMTVFGLQHPGLLGKRDLPNARAYLARIAQRPAHIRAMQIAGPDATPPTGT